jgi:hypothetical protein
MNIDRVVAMGGAFDAPGNPPTVVDLSPGMLTVVCIAIDGGTPVVTGRATLTVEPR